MAAQRAPGRYHGARCTWAVYIGSRLDAWHAIRGTPGNHSQLVNSHAIRRGPLLGFSIGGNARLEQRKVVGYEARTVTMTNGGLDGVIRPASDTDPTYYRDPILAGAAFVGNPRKIFNDRVS